MSTHKLADPLGYIEKTKKDLNPHCKVRKSPYCDHIIALWLHGSPYLKIEKWLVDRGPEHRIPSPTIFRNFKEVKRLVTLPFAEEQAERFGGVIEIDISREMAGLILAQRERIDKLLRREQFQQKSANPDYHDHRIRKEMELQLEQLKTAAEYLDKLEDQRHDDPLEQIIEAGGLVIAPEVESALTDMLLHGEIAVKKAEDDIGIKH